MTDHSKVAVTVELINDDGDKTMQVGWGEDANAAAQDAERIAEENTGDDSWTMNEWRPAS